MALPITQAWAPLAGAFFALSFVHADSKQTKCDQEILINI
jgi:hypothetical protein